MFLLDCVPPGKATGRLKEIYQVFPPEVGPPQPLQLMSASPGLMVSQSEVLKYFSSHKKLGFSLLAAIRYLAASYYGYDYCIRFNQSILEAAGATQQELNAIKNDPDKAPLEENEKALLKFVAKAIAQPERIDAQDVADIRNHGWKDPDIFDAVAHAAFMQGHATLMKAFAEK